MSDLFLLTDRQMRGYRRTFLWRMGFHGWTTGGW